MDRTTLEPVAARALGAEAGDQVAVTSFRSEQIVGGYGVNLGVHRWTGSAQYRGQDVPWAAVLKIVDGSRHDHRGWDYWRREASAYESGLLADLPGGLSAPRFLGLEERSDGTLWLWLESVSMEDDPIWPIPRYGLAARHLGQFNAGYLVDRPLPRGAAWLARQWLRSWVDAAEPAVNLFRAVRDEPLVSRAYPSEVATGILRLWDEKERWLSPLESCLKPSATRTHFAAT